MKANRLTDLKITRVDLVDKGANYDPATGEGAHVLLYKRDDSGGDVKKDEEVSMACKSCDESMKKGLAACEKCQKAFKPGDMPNAGKGKPKNGTDKDDASALKSKENTMKLDELPEDVRKFVEGLQTEVADFKKAAADAKALADAAPKKEEDVLKSLDATARAVVEKAIAAAEDARKEVAKLHDEQRTVEFAKRASKLVHLPSWTSEKGGKLLKGVHDKAPELVAELEAILKAADEAIESGALFSEQGKAGGFVKGSAAEQVEAMIGDRVSKKLAKDSVEAISQIMKERPDLYAKYRKETQVRGGRPSYDE